MASACALRPVVLAAEMPMLNAIGTSLVAVGASGVATAANDAPSGPIDGSVAAEHRAGGLLGGRPSRLGDVPRFLKISVADRCKCHADLIADTGARAGRDGRRRHASSASNSAGAAGFGEPKRRARRAHEAAAQTVISS